jgi:uncharacterized protein (AIM24 family)
MSAIALVDCTRLSAGAATQTSTWVGDDSSSWSDAGNWSPGNAFPSNGNGSISDFDVVINSVSSPDTTPILNVTATVDSLTLNTNAMLTLNPGQTLNVGGPTLLNEGTIQVDTFHSNADLNFVSTTLLTGSGTVMLDDYAPNAQLTASAGATLTNDTNQTIDGIGEIDAPLVNNGTVNANFDSGNRTLLLQTNNMTNNATFEATGGGILDVSGITVSQGASANITAGNGSEVVFTNATISGGTLNTAPNTAVSPAPSNAGVMIVSAGSTLTVIGPTLTNNGTIQVDTFHSDAAVNFATNTLLTGSGTVFLDDFGPNAEFTAMPGVTVTQDVNHTIDGIGEIDAALTNNGTVNANFSGGNRTLVLQTNNMTNNATFEATGGGILDINGITVTQGANGNLIAGNGSEVIFTNATISGGTLDTAANTAASQAPSNAGIMIVSAASTLTVTGSALTNNGTLQVDTYSSNADLNFATNMILTGSGTVFLDDNNPNARLTAPAGVTVTQQSGSTIDGIGEIDAAIVNNGTVNANLVVNSSNKTLFLQTNNMTNNALFEATGGGVLDINGITVTQGATGNINAGNGSTVIFSNATVSGGALSTAANTAVSPAPSNAGVIQAVGTDTINSIVNNGEIVLSAASTLNVISPTLTNNGMIQVDTLSSNADLNFVSNTVLTGSGTVMLDDFGPNARLTTSSGATLTNDTNETIDGIGEIDATLVNNGTVNANFNSGNHTLLLQTNNMTNNTTFEATGGGILEVSGIAVTQGANGSIFAANGSTVIFSNAMISGGTLNTAPNTAVAPAPSNAGVIQTLGVVTINSLINNAGAILVSGGSALTVVGTTLTNNGSFSNNGTLYINAVSNSGTFTQSGTLTETGNFTNSGTATFGGSQSWAAGTILTTNAGGMTTLQTDAGSVTSSPLSINVTGGQVILDSQQHWAALSISGDGALDITNNKLFIDYGTGPDPIASIVQWIKNGFYGLSGPEIISSAIATDDALSGLSYGIGYADGADGVVTGLPSGEIEIAFTLLGDANLDGTVNAEDFTPFSHNLGQPGGWDQGDFNYDGTVNAEDFTSFSHNLNQSAVLAGALESAGGINLANVPEPLSAGMMVIAGLGFLSRRRRSSRR